MSFWTSKGSCNEHRCHKLGSLARRWAIHLSEQVQCEYARRLDGGAQTFKTGTTNFSIDLHWWDAAGDPLNSSLTDSSSEVHKWHSKARESCLSSQRFRNTIIIFAAFCCSVGEMRNAKHRITIDTGSLGESLDFFLLFNIKMWKYAHCNMELSMKEL